MSNIKTILLFCICLVFFTVVSIMLYRTAQKPADAPPIYGKMDETDDGCPSGYDQFESAHIVFCYPFDMELVSESVATDSADFSLTLSSEDDELVVTNSHMLYPIHLCNSETEVHIASVSARQIAFRKESVAGCGAISRYLLVTSDPSDDWSIELRSFAGTYEDDRVISVIRDSVQFP